MRAICITNFRILGDYILLEMLITVVCILTAVGIMYLHSQATFGRRVPKFLLAITCSSNLKVEQQSKSAQISQSFT